MSQVASIKAQLLALNTDALTALIAEVIDECAYTVAREGADENEHNAIYQHNVATILSNVKKFTDSTDLNTSH